MTVTDDGPLFHGDALANGGIGLRNARERLHLCYGTNFSFRAGTGAHGGGEAEVRVPVNGPLAAAVAQ